MQGYTKILIGMALALLTLIAYYPAISANMVADDFRIVNRLDFDDAFRSLHETVGYGRNEYRPLVAFSYAFSNALWNGDSRGYHLDSIFLHILNVLLIYSWFLLLTGSVTASALAAVLFAVHPIHHARVTWIAARDSLLSTFFMVAALIPYTLAQCRNNQTGGSGNTARRLLISFSVGMFSLSLISYEGAVIMPVILIGLEIFLFAPPYLDYRKKMRNAVIKTLAYTIVLASYLVWWLFLFHGEVGGYDLSYSIGNIGNNYYRLLYQLFHGIEHITGVLYFSLLLLIPFLPSKQRSLVWFSILFMLIAVIPFVLIDGFASRFAYTSAIGYVLLIGALLSPCIWIQNIGPVLKHKLVPLVLSTAIFVTIASYYIVELRSRISEWHMAGEIAESIPRQIKERHPDLPDGSTLILSGIPVMHGHAYVFPLVGLRSSIGNHYPGRKLQIFYGPDDIHKTVAEEIVKSENTHLYRYASDTRSIEAID